jgi:hypothetical protein
MKEILSLVLVVLATAARGEDLATFLAGATEAARVPAVVRADGEITHEGLDGTTTDTLVLLRNQSGDLFLELRQAGLRALVPARGDKAYQRAKGAKAAAPIPMDAPIAGTDFTAEDLRPFDAARYGSPIIADRSDRQVTVSLDPQDSQYTLVVITFDRERKTPVKTMYYTDTLNNLTKMKLEGRMSEVAGRSLPGEIGMEAFKLRTSTRLNLRWRTDAEASGDYFDPKSFAPAPAIVWPEK